MTNNDTAAAQEHYQALKPMAGYLVVAVSVDRVLGLLAKTLGDLDQPISHFEDASEFLRPGDIRPEIAWNCYDLAGTLLLRNTSGDRQHASELLDETVKLADEMEIGILKQKAVSLQDRLGTRQTRSLDNPVGLTQREIEVLQAVAQGRSNKGIGEELGLSALTVKSHLARIARKLGTGDRAEMVALGMRAGLLR